MRDDTASAVALAAELRAFLVRSRASLDEEIRTYPTPIPRCDAQFNFVYEQRARVSQWLSQLDAALDGGEGSGALASATAAFVSAPPLGSSTEEQALRKRLVADRPTSDPFATETAD